MKYLIGAVIGVLLGGAGYAMAASQGTSGLSIVDHANVGWSVVDKVYDVDTNVICYVANRSGSAVAISCLKNL